MKVSRIPLRPAAAIAGLVLLSLSSSSIEAPATRYGNIPENAGFRVTMSVAVSGGNVAVTGKVFRHSAPSDPGSPLGSQVGATLSFRGAKPAGVDATGEVGLVASAASTFVNSSAANFTVGP